MKKRRGWKKNFVWEPVTNITIDDKILEAMRTTNLSAYESRVFWTLYSLGAYTKTIRIALSRLKALTKIDKGNIWKALSRLILRRIVLANPDKRSSEYEIRDPERWLDKPDKNLKELMESQKETAVTRKAKERLKRHEEFKRRLRNHLPELDDRTIGIREMIDRMKKEKELSSKKKEEK